MSTAADMRLLALALDGTTEAPHFDRAAFGVARIYAALAADGKTANLRFAPAEQALKCLTAPEAFDPVANAWGKQGWTTVTLAKIDEADLATALQTAWRHALPKAKGTKPARKR